MKPVDVKILLLRKGLTISGIAQILIAENLIDTSNLDSVRTMVTAILYGKSWYPTLATTLNTRFNLNVTRAAHLKPVRKIIKEAA